MNTLFHLLIFGSIKSFIDDARSVNIMGDFNAIIGNQRERQPKTVCHKNLLQQDTKSSKSITDRLKISELVQHRQ